MVISCGLQTLTLRPNKESCPTCLSNHYGPNGCVDAREFSSDKWRLGVVANSLASTQMLGVNIRIVLYATHTSIAGSVIGNANANAQCKRSLCGGKTRRFYVHIPRRASTKKNISITNKQHYET